MLLNPASLTGGAATPTLPFQGLQVQTVTPQILLNNQGQIIATVGNGHAAVTASAAVQPKAAAPSVLSKPNAQVNNIKREVEKHSVICFYTEKMA